MRHFVVQDVFRKMAMYAPSFGMLGTLIGLIQMLSLLASPDSLGPAMAIALLTTFYDTLLSTVIFLPIAGKLRSRTLADFEDEAYKELVESVQVIDGDGSQISIIDFATQRGRNPRPLKVV